ncbi:hypothetical protein EDF72_3789 [Delftia acidovorans]|uniref:hypothetical protein n=1 Tax=Delftia acidovorans TaxID=80866 RepID=UPI000F9B5603|nr:hypothetical protein [Delftia acidovorans]ROQ93158.1 hypothetical protein EDF72_3789 [Delftia acidovorans]
MDKEKPSEQVLASPTLNSNSGKPTSSPRETTAVSLTPNVTNARVYTRYVPGTSARIKVAGDDVAALLQKPRGQVSKDEITGMLGKLSRMEAGGEPLQGAEFLNRQSLFMAVVTRGVSEGLLTPQEVTSYRVFNQAAVGAMAMSGGGAKLPGRGVPNTGASLPRTKSSTIIPRTNGGTQNNGVVVERAPRYGPFYRVPPDRKEIELVNQSGELWGQSARNYMPGLDPAAKAYSGALPKDAIGYEFYTTVPPTPGHVPGQPLWRAGSPGVITFERNGAEWSKIPIEITRINK